MPGARTPPAVTIISRSGCEVVRMAIGYDDVFTRLEKTRAHLDAAGVDPEYLTSLIR